MAAIFISYSHQDETWKDRVVQQLGVLAGEGLETWDDRRIAGGGDWKAEIELAMAHCQAALLLISADFLTSDFILGAEVPALLQRREREGMRVIPVILRPCPWKRVGWLQGIQARPKDGKPLSGMSAHKAEQALADLAAEVHDLLVLPAQSHGNAATAASAAGPKIDLTRLPAGAAHFQGRQEELHALHAAWEPAAKIAIVELIAPGGTGKTALLGRWLEQVGQAGWGGARQVYAWSFYSQGTGDDRQASEDLFFAQALQWFGVDIRPDANAADKGRALALRIAASRSLLVLDGLEPLQYPPGPLAGELRAPGLQALLAHLASAGHAGLCVISSREKLSDLDSRVRNESHPAGPVLRLDLDNLSETDGARLLHAEGACRAGQAAIAADDPELREASRTVEGHALTLALLGRYLAKAHGGDIRKAQEVDFAKASAKLGGHAFRVIAAIERWLIAGGADSAAELAAVRLLGYFDRPATARNLQALRAPPAIPGLTAALADLGDADWNFTLANLAECRLLSHDPASGSLDAHPLVREYFAQRLEQDQPEAWREGHRRIYVQLKTDTPQRPDGLAGLQPLYQAVAHGYKAGLYEDACAEVYRDRILRGTGHDGFYSTRKLGAFGADLGAVACFFVEPWRRPAPQLQDADQSWLLNQAAFRLRALGRLAEALEPMRAGAEMDVRGEDWKNAAISYGNLSELQLTLGHIAAAVQDAARAVEYADRSGDAFQRMSKRTTLADARQQQGEAGQAQEGYTAAEAIQAERQPQYPLLYSMQGFQYCELLLAPVERAAWRGARDEAALQACAEVARRAAQILEWDKPFGRLLDLGLRHLTLARCALCTDLLQNRPPGDDARRECESAVSGLRAAGYQDDLPRGLLTRAWLRHACGDSAGCRADLQEVETIASRGGMKLFLADLALTRARLFRDRAQLQLARDLITECGYGRRLPELQDAETALIQLRPQGDQTYPA